MKHSLLNIAAVALLTGCSSGGSNSPATPAPAPSASPSTPAAGQAGGSAPAAQTPGAAPTPAVNQVNPVSVGFYGQRHGQHAETAGWVNAAWECFWDDDNEAGAIANLRHGVPTTLDVYGYLYVVGNDSSGLRPDQEMGLVPGGSDLNYLAPDVDAYMAKARTFKRRVHILAFAGRLSNNPPKNLKSILDQPPLLAEYRAAFGAAMATS